jgi:hypothetical protein
MDLTPCLIGYIYLIGYIFMFWLLTLAVEIRKWIIIIIIIL